MSIFSDYLKKQRDEKNIALLNIAEKTGRSLSDISRWIKGERTPENIQAIDKLSMALRLTENETNELVRCYKIVTVGEEKYNDFEAVVNLIRKIQICRDEYIGTYYVANRSDDVPEIKGNVILENKSQVISTIKKMLIFMDKKSGEKINIQTYGYKEELNSLLKPFCSQEDIKNIDIIVFANSEVSYRHNHNHIDLVTSLMDILYKNNDLKIWINDDNIMDSNAQKNYISSDYFVLSFNADFTEGILTTDEAFIQFEKNSFEKTKAISKAFINKNDTHVDRLDKEVLVNECTKRLCVEFQPCMGPFLTREMIDKITLKNIPNRDEIIDMVTSTFVNFYLDNPKKQVISFFTEAGLRDFLENGIFAAFPYPLYDRCPSDLAMKIVDSVIQNNLNSNTQNYLIKNKELDNLTGIHIELSYCEVKNIIIDIDKGNRILEHVIITNEDIIKVFENFFETIEKVGLYYDLEESTERMKQILEEYKNSL